MDTLDNYTQDELNAMSPKEFVERFSYLKDSEDPKSREMFEAIEKLAEDQVAADVPIESISADQTGSAEFVKPKVSSVGSRGTIIGPVVTKILGFLFGNIVYPAFIILGCVVLVYRLFS